MMNSILLWLLVSFSLLAAWFAVMLKARSPVEECSPTDMQKPSMSGTPWDALPNPATVMDARAFVAAVIEVQQITESHMPCPSEDWYPLPCLPYPPWVERPWRRDSALPGSAYTTSA